MRNLPLEISLSVSAAAAVCIGDRTYIGMMLVPSLIVRVSSAARVRITAASRPADSDMTPYSKPLVSASCQHAMTSSTGMSNRL